MGRGETMVRNGAKKMTRAYLCKVCGKEGILTNIRNHIEAMHIEGIMIPCDHCGKTFKTRNGIRAHMLVHKEKQAFLFLLNYLRLKYKYLELFCWKFVLKCRFFFTTLKKYFTILH